MKHRTKLRIWTINKPEEQRFLRTPVPPLDLPRLSDQTVQQFIDDLSTTMHQADGVGMAASQTGQSLRIAIIAAGVDPQRAEDLILVNPTIIQQRSEQITNEEGCLSIPKVFGLVPRAVGLTLRFFDRQGRPISLEVDDFFARVIQHEVDHLNGTLFIDRVTTFTKGQQLLP